MDYNNRPFRPSGHDSSMYDDEPYTNNSERASQGYQNFRKDTQISPQGTSATYSRDDHYNERNGHERSRSPRREGRGRYQDRDQEGYSSPRRRSRSRSRSPYYGAPPNRTIILEALPANMTQEDILHELQGRLHVEGIEEVRLIKDKRTGLSRQFAFAQFVGVSVAKAFLEQYYPAVSLYGSYDPAAINDSEPTKVRIAFSREKDDRTQPGKNDDDWKCDVCFLTNYSNRIMCHRCNAPRTRASTHGLMIAQTHMSSFSGFATTGDSDAAPDTAPSQYLLVRSLEPGVNEEILSKGICKLYRSKPVQLSAPKQIKKNMSSTTDTSVLGAKDGSLRRVLLVRDRKSNDSWRYGFAEFSTVDDAQCAMAKFKASDRFTISSKPVLLSYIHAGVFVPVLHPMAPESERFTFSPLSNNSMKLMYWDEAAYASELVTAVAPRNEQGSDHENALGATAHEDLIPTGRDAEPKTKKRKIEKDASGSSKKIVAPHLQFWTNRHAELHGLPPKDESANVEPSSELTKQAQAAPPSQTFADLERKCCLLCSRQFKTEAEVNKHERVSQLHRDNMKDDGLVAKAIAKLSKISEPSEDNSAYRDRAKERRTAFNQPKQPAPQQHNRSKDPSQTSVKVADDPPPPSKGAALLGKMGWTAGEGLGAQGTGRTEAIKPDIYTQGVGLGAAGGKVGDAAEEADRQTKGTYKDFLNKTKDKAKERFQSMK